jgi:hypothetical protein
METPRAAAPREDRLDGKVIRADDLIPSPPSPGIILTDDPSSNQPQNYEPTNSLPSISTFKRKLDNAGNHFIATVFLFFHLFLLCLSRKVVTFSTTLSRPIGEPQSTIGCKTFDTHTSIIIIHVINVNTIMCEGIVTLVRCFFFIIIHLLFQNKFHRNNSGQKILFRQKEQTHCSCVQRGRHYEKF